MILDFFYRKSVALAVAAEEEAVEEEVAEVVIDSATMVWCWSRRVLTTGGFLGLFIRFFSCYSNCSQEVENIFEFCYALDN